MKTLELLYDLKSKNILLWHDEDFNLKYSFDKKNPPDTSLIHTIKEHKPSLVAILKFNAINNENKARATLIYKVPEEERNYQLSPIQTGIYLQSTIDKLTYSYNVPLFIPFEGADLQKLKTAITQLLGHCDILRMTLVDEAHYKIVPLSEFKIEQTSVCRDQVLAYCEQRYQLPFLLQGGKLIQTEIISVRNSNETIVNLTHHHILSDAASIGLLFDLLKRIYYGSEVISDTVSYFDFKEKQRHALNGHDYQKALETLAAKFDRAEPLSLARSTHQRHDNVGDSFYSFLDKTALENLGNLSYQHGVSLYAILMTVFYRVLQVFSGELTQFPVGITVSNRPFELSESIGPFISTLPFIMDEVSDCRLLDDIKNVHKELLFLNNFNGINLNLIAEKLQRPADDLFSLMQVMFTLHNFQDNTIRQKIMNVAEPSEKFGLSITAARQEEGLSFYVSFAVSLYEKTYIQSIIHSYLIALRGITNAALFNHTSLLPLLTEEEATHLRRQARGPEDFHIHWEPIPTIFQQHVKLNPKKIALVSGTEKINYFDLDSRANQLAHYLENEYLIAEKDCVALAMDGGTHFIIAMLAVLKLGAIYVPISPSLPPSRIQTMLMDTNSKIILTQHNTAYDVSISNDVPVVILDSTECLCTLKTFSTEYQNRTLSASDLAYVMYTSGTTGEPKGVMVTQIGVVSLVTHTDYIHISEKDNFLQLSDTMFDASTFEIWGALLNGATLHLPENKFDFLSYPHQLLHYMVDHRITILWLTKTLFEHLYGLDEKIFAPLNYLLVGGEALNQHVMAKLITSKFRPKKVLNGYGPTENTTFSCLYDIDETIQEKASVPIGKAFSHRFAYVLNQHLKLLPVGAVGELYVGGLGLSRGYLNNEAETAHSFVSNPLQTMAEKKQGIHAKLYRTGDLVRLDASGLLEYRGRSDRQIKLRGYRIELDAIVNLLNQYPHIEQAVVTLYSDKAALQQQLVGYFVADQPIHKSNLFAYLSQKLPAYMLPSALIQLDNIPYTKNGKLDNAKLPAPEWNCEDSIILPASKLQKIIADVWSTVLGVAKEQIGLHTSFFSLGGNSLSAIITANQLNAKLNASISARDIFLHKTIFELETVLEKTVGKTVYAPFMLTATKSLGEDSPDLYQSFPLTNVQQAYHLGRLKSFGLGNVATHIYMEHTFLQLAVDRLEWSFNKLLSRHPALRTIFETDSQKFIEKVPYYKIVVKECSSADERYALRSELSHKIYDPAAFPLFDIVVSKTPENTVLHLSFDALVMDAQSFRNFFDEWSLLYSYPDRLLPLLGISYRDYVLQYEKIRQSDLFIKAKNYWLAKLDDYDFSVYLPTEVNADQIKTPLFSRISTTLSEKTWQAIGVKARQHGISPTVVLLTLYGHVLCHFSAQSKMCINLTLFNRIPLHAEVDHLVGDFTVLELFNFTKFPSATILSQLQVNHQNLWNDIEHNLFDGIDLQRWVRKLKSISANQIIAPLVFTSILGNLADYQKQGVLLDPSYQGETYSITQSSQVWLDNKVYEVGSALVIEWDYVEQLFDKEMLQAMHTNYCQLITALADADWEDSLIPLIQLPEQDMTVIEAANAAEQILSEDTLFSRLHHVIQSKPEIMQAIAVIDSQQAAVYTYQQLLQEADYLSRYLATSGTEAILMAVLCEKGYLQVVATLAIMMAGHAYLPLHVDWPNGRLHTVLEQGQVDIVLISKAQFARLDSEELTQYHFIIIDTWLEEVRDNAVLQQSLCAMERPTVTANDPAYVIFTSGSTGVPKGVTISHRGAMNTIDAVNQRFDVQQRDVVLALSELSFDLSVYDIFGLLQVGGTIVFPAQTRVKDPSHWLELIEQHSVTIWNTVPQLADLLADEALQTETNIASIRGFLLSGDWIPLTLPDRLKSCSAASIVMSLGGATEGSIWSIWHEINAVNPSWRSIPYGRAMPNQKMLVLNTFLEHCPLNVIGEIYIGGIGVALNYWGDAKKAAASFVEHPTLGRLYKTGDLGRWHPDGYMEFIGRQDNQLKIRGYRVELGDIEYRLSTYANIQQAVVIAKREALQKNPYLISYYVSDSPLDEKALAAYLHQHLPDYMVPGVFIHLETLPLTANGKVDTKALPNPNLDTQHPVILPRDALEEKVCQIFATALGLSVEQVGIQNDFFSLGGDSIISIQLSSQLRQQLGIAITLQDIFSCKTVLALCERIKAEQGKEALPIQREEGILTGEVDLLPIQAWFFAENFEYASHWNQSFLIRTPVLSIERLETCIQPLIKQHDAFRLCYRGTKQYYAEKIPHPKLNTLDLTTLPFKEGSAEFETALQAILTEWQSHFSLENGPLTAFGYLYGYANGSARVFVAMHHLLVDTVSWRIIAEDLQALYEGKSLAKKGSSYRLWVNAITHYAKTHADEKHYWQKVMADYQPNLLDISRTREIARERILMNPELTKKLLQHCSRAYHTKINDLLLTAVALALTDKDHIPVHHLFLEGHGREPIDNSLDVSQTVGWFAALFPVRLSIKNNIAETIKFIKETLHNIPANGIGYGALIGYTRDLQPQIGFNYLGQFEKSATHSLWATTSEIAGETLSSSNHSHMDLHIAAAVIDDQFIFDISGLVSQEYVQSLAKSLQMHLTTIIQHCTEKTYAEYTQSDFLSVKSEANLSNLPLLLNTQQKFDWFPMTEIQKVYLLGRFGNYEIGNVSNHVYHEYYYQNLDVKKLERILNQAIQSYDVLRTVFSLETLQQRFLRTDEVNHYSIRINDFSDHSYHETTLLDIRDRLSHKVYDPEKYPLFTYEITHFENCFLLHISTDLILLDAHSRQSLFEQIDFAYRSSNYTFPVPQLTFRDYQIYYQFLRQSPWYHKDKAYWQAKLENMPTRPEFPFLMEPERIEYPKFTEHTLYIDKTIWQQFKEKARHYNVSTSSVLLGLYGIVLSRFSGREEFLITMTLFNRYSIDPAVDQLWGDFTSTNLFHFKNFGIDLLATLKHTHETMWHDIQHALYTGMDVQREFAKKNALDTTKAVSPIVFTGLIGHLFDEIEERPYLENNEAIPQRFWSGQTSQAWIDLQAIEFDAKFMSKWLYVDQLFSPEYIATLNRLYCALIGYLAENDWQQPTTLFQLPDRDQAVVDAANTAEQILSEDTLFSRLHYVIQSKPEIMQAIAVIDSQQAAIYTYQQLLQEADYLSRYLATSGTEAVLMAVLCEKGYLQVVATLAIMMAGHAYLPLHVDWPSGRLHTVLEQGQVDIVLISKAQFARLNSEELTQYHFIIIDTWLEEVRDNVVLQQSLCAIERPTVTADDPAYVIFTSGSTGVPKGVTISHRGAMNTIDAVNRRFDVRQRDVVLSLSELSFDLSVYDIFGLLQVGGTIVFPAQTRVKDPSHWLELIEQHSVTIWNTVPQLADLLADEALQTEVNIASIRGFLLSGDWIPLTLPDRLKSCSAASIVMSLGGATEGSIWSIWHEINAVNPSWRSIPYGRAMPNQKMLVLNTFLEHCPLNVIGEIYIGGIGVALNYWGDAKKTAASFVEHPTLGRLYKTGDLGRWHPDGYMEFIGRQDNQLKIRGYRVELGDIEHRLSTYANIQQAVVIAKRETLQKNPYLISYYVSDSPLDEKAMAAYLHQHLPDYMVPSVFIHLETLPLTANGKVDTRALPNPDLDTQHPVILPRDALEEKVCQIFATALGLSVEQVGIQNDFFSLGGDSIISIQLSSQLRQQLGIAITLQDIFSCKTVLALCERIKAEQGKEALPIQREEGVLTGEVDLLPIQAWFFAENFEYASHWNQSFLIRTPLLSIERLETCIQPLIEQHDVFRLCYRGTKQYYAEKIPHPKLNTLDLTTLPFKEGSAEFETALQAILTEWQSHFSLEQGPLTAFGYLYGYANGSARVFVAMHHLLVDTVSWRIIAEDLQALYEGKSLAKKGSSYRLWVNAITHYAKTHADEKHYWQKVMADYQPLLVEKRAVSDIQFNLATEKTAALLSSCHKAYHTQTQDLLITALAYALLEMTSLNHHHVLLEGHGREPIDDSIDITQTVGWFTSIYPVRLAIAKEIKATIKSIKENLRAVPSGGIAYAHAMTDHNHLPKISFNYLGKFNADDKKPWSITLENSGESIHPSNAFSNDIGIIAYVQHEKLHVKLYTKFGDYFTRALSQAFENHLLQTINHCLTANTVEYTASDFAAIANEGDLKELPLLHQKNQYDWFPMTEIQKVYLLGRLANYEIGNVANHIYNEYAFDKLDVNKLEGVINKLIENYSVLRTVYCFETLQQRFLKKNEISPYHIVVTNHREIPYNMKTLEEIRQHLSHKVYNPEKFPLFTFQVTHFADGDVLHISIDLILLDAQSRQAMFTVMNQWYRGNENVQIPSISFKDYQDYYQYLKNSRWYERDKHYWHKKLPHLPLRPELSLLVAPDSIAEPKFSEHTLYISDPTWSAFKRQAQKYGLSYSSVLLGLYGAVIGYYSGSVEFLITMTLFNRYALHPEVNALWGDFTSTNLFHFKNFSKEIFKTLERTHEVMWQDINHALYTGMDVQRELAKRHKLDGNKAVSPIVFTGIFGNLLDETDKSLWLDDGEQMNKRYWCGQTSQAWIDLQAIEANGKFMSKWLYVDQLFSPEYIATLNHLYCALIGYLAENDWQQPTTLFQLPDRDQAVVDAANAAEQILSEDTLFSRFQSKPEIMQAVAVIDSQQAAVYTYQQLQQEADYLSRYLATSGTEAVLMAVLAEKGYLQVVATLAIMMAGHAYLPLHVDWPSGRLHTVLEQGQVDIVLISKAQFTRLNSEELTRYHFIIIDTWLEEVRNNVVLQQSLCTIERPTVTADDPAYVIFTSGSTGVPKGVTISHRGAMNTIDAVNQRFDVQQRDVVLALSELSFDLSVYDIFGLLQVGGTIVFPAQTRVKDPSHWLELIEQHSVTIWNTVPQLADLLADEALQTETNIASIRGFLLSGDWIPLTLPDRLKSCSAASIVMSLGGATEGSIWSIWHEINAVNPSWRSIPYGRAMPNQKMLVLNTFLEHCPLNVIGEIYIGGIGVALNYWGDAKKTAASFVEHPTLGRLYKTGDLGRWHPDGYMEFIGRQDNQLKIRGYRVELGDIEYRISTYANIQQAVVIAKRETLQKNPYLISYYVSDSPLDEKALAAYLHQHLPDYMVPGVFIHLETLPLTANGKIDVNALSAPIKLPAIERIPPNSLIEKELVKIWAELLAIDSQHVSITDNFFDAGGDSILLMRMKSKITQSFPNVPLTITDLFKYTTISEFAKYMTELTENSDTVTSHHPKRAVTSIVADSDIAIIGLSGAFPHAQSVDEFWENILIGKECFDQLSLDQCRKQGVPHRLLQDKNFIPISGKVDEIDVFDPTFWQMSIKDASTMDPQIRQLMQQAWSLLEKTGYIRERKQINIGVFAGMSDSRYTETRIQAHPTMLGIEHLNERDYLAPRVSYSLGLTGPSISVNTACSTSLIAIIEACKTLCLGYCDMALAGGVSFQLPEHHGYVYYPGGIYSQDGHCRVFDKDASGTVGGAGIGIVALKRLNDAKRDRDHIIAVVKGYAANNDGDKKVSFTAPSIVGQTNCILQAQQRGNVDADTIDYVECHGTGTAMGDPIEIAALHEAFTQNLQHKNYACQLGAVKANIGHAASAAGIAGFIKVSKMLETKILPPQRHFNTINPDIHLEKTGFYISTEKRTWEKRNAMPRRAAISSFGFGGTNAHVILEEYTEKESGEKVIYPDAPIILPISAKSIESCERYCQALASYLEQHPLVSLHDVAKTLQYHREIFDCRAIVTCTDRASAIHLLQHAKAKKGAALEASDTLFSEVETLWLMGHPIDWGVVDPATKCARHLSDMPTYQFQKQRCWIDLPAIPSADSKNFGNETKPILVEFNRSGIEVSLSKQFSEVLGNPTIGQFDSFFDLGGSSLSVVDLVDLIKQHFGMEIPLSVIYQHQTVAQLADYISRKNQHYEPILKLTGNRNKNKIFFIHPGLGGCEVYADLATALQDFYDSYGVDSYNLYHDNKIQDRQELATYYLTEIMKLNKNDHYHLAGWSLGGVIAIQVALLLEDLGFTSIQLSLFDSMVDDEFLSQIKTKKEYIHQLEVDYQSYLQENGYADAHIKRSLPNINIALDFENQKFPKKLIHTQAILFKALAIDPLCQQGDLGTVFNHLVQLTSNNLDGLFLHAETQLRVVNLADYHHNNILAARETITSTLSYAVALAT